MVQIDTSRYGLSGGAECSLTERGKYELRGIYKEISEIDERHIHTAIRNGSVDMNEIEDVTGFRYLGAGQGRSVFDPVGDGLMKGGVDCVAKVANGELVKDNLREVQNWLMLDWFDPPIKERYNPIMEWDENMRWVLTPKAEITADYDDVMDLGEEIEKTIWYTGDVEERNFGIVDGKLKCIDYGGPFINFPHKLRVELYGGKSTLSELEGGNGNNFLDGFMDRVKRLNIEETEMKTGIEGRPQRRVTEWSFD